MIPFLLLLLPTFSSPVNPCAVDPGACVPLEDFGMNCTCILTYGKPINATDDVYMFLLGHHIPLKLFRQVEMPLVFRKKLKQRIPSSLDFDPSLEFPEYIARNLHVEEKMVLFVVNSTYTGDILTLLANNSILKTEESKDFKNWCSEGECNAVIDTTVQHNVTAGVYSHAADILQVVELRGSSVVAASSVRADFDIPKVQSIICEMKCTRFQPGDGSMCRKHCTQRMRYDNVAVMGQLKRDFQMFVRGAAAKNLREKYYKYLNLSRKI